MPIPDTLILCGQGLKILSSLGVHTIHEQNGYFAAYVKVSGIRRHLRIHQILMPDVYPIDHINGNKHDNRLCNLRACTHSQNQMNMPVRCDSKSGITGVSKSYNRWRATITKEGKTHSLGCYATIDEAASVRRQAEEKYFGEFAPIKQGD